LCRSTFGDPAHDAARVLDKLDPLLSGLQHEFNPVTITRIGVASVYVDRLGECREALGRVVRDGRDGGAIALAINALLSMCNDDWLTGRWDEAEELAIEGTKLCEKHGYRRYAFMLGGFIRALVAAARGNDAIAISAAEELTDWAAATGCGIAEAFGHHLKAISSIANGDFEGAYQHASSISPAGVLAPFAPHALWVSFDLVEAAVKANRLDEAKAHVAALRENRISEISSRLALVVAGCTALAAPTEVCTSLFEEALATPGASRWPFDLARVRLAYGEHLRRVHSMTESWNQLRRALESFQALKADPWERRATNELRATGLPLPQKPMARVVTLSAQDLEIATLAASGLTNKQIAARLNLSPRTVGARLYRIFPILGITSRAALHDALRAVRAG
jgi:DNA-binding CsgD family transcriptional regulator